MIKWSFITLLMSSSVIILMGYVTLVTLSIINVIHPSYQTAKNISVDEIATIFILITTAGLGMFESNAIQFGMDQMLEASSEQLSSFVHWYFWCAHLWCYSVLQWGYLCILKIANFRWIMYINFLPQF